MTLSRRHVLQGALAATAAGLTPRTARAQAAEKSTVVIVNLPGGLHNLYAQADMFVARNLFGCTGSNTRDLGNGIVVDNETFGTLPPEVLARMCNVGVWHGISAHHLAQLALHVDSRSRSYPLQLAAAMGTDAPVACAHLGTALPGQHEPVGAANMQRLSDAGGILTALGVRPAGEFIPERAPALAGLRASLRMSAPTLGRNQRSLASLTSGLTGVVRALAAPPVDVDWPSIAAAYGLSPTDTLISGFASQFAAAELLIHAGTNVVLISALGPGCTLGWDTHGDNDGACARRGATELLLPSLRTFLSRTLMLAGHNVVTALVGDFTRAYGSEHAGMLVASVWGPHVVAGTSGRFNITGTYNGYAPVSGTRPSVAQLYAFLAAAAQVSTTPFGANPHPFV